MAKTFAVSVRQISGKSFQQLRSIFCFRISGLFKLNNITANFPICRNHS